MGKEFWFKLAQKTFIMMGFTYFSVAIVNQELINSLVPAFLASGLYCFAELGRHFKVHSENTVLKARKKKTKEIHFLI